MNNINIDRKRECTGCSACLGMCPKGAITIGSDEYSFYKPYINNELCVDCGLCQKVCYSHNDISNNNSVLNAYYGWNNEPDVLNRSASGGITSAISSCFLEKGFSVIGCSYNYKQEKAEHILINSYDDIDLILGSKYFQSDMNNIIRTLTDLPRNSKLVIFGLPCQLFGIKSLMNELHYDFTSIYFVELFCHGVVSPLVWREYLKYNKKAKDSNKIVFRSKYYGWHIPANEFVNGNEISVSARYGDPFFELFYSKELFGKACYKCDIRKIIDNCDLKIGDFWGSRFNNNNTGVSCIISASNKGLDILDTIKNRFELHECNINELLSAQSYNTNYDNYDVNKWERNYLLLKKFGIKAVKKSINKEKPLLKRVKRTLFIFLSNIKHSIFR